LSLGEHLIQTKALWNSNDEFQVIPPLLGSKVHLASLTTSIMNILI